MTSDAEILVTCTNGSCSLRNRVPLLDYETLILIHTEEAIPSFDEVQASNATVACPACVRAGRDGTLMYVSDHLRKAPPDWQVPVPAVFDGLSSLWKRAQELASVTGQVASYKPEKLAPPIGVRLEVRPYGGYMLRPGNNDEGPQYAELPAGQPALDPKPRYIRELKHDLLYLAYYGTRERDISKDLGGVSVFEAMTVGAILALKFDLSFFYGVPTTTDLEAATVSDSEVRRLTLAEFSKPIFFESKMLDNPIRPIAEELLYPLGAAMADFQEGHTKIGEALDLLRQSGAAELSAGKAKALRAKARQKLAGATRKLPAKAVALELGDLAAIQGQRRERALDAVLAHPCFAPSKRKPWPWFEACLRAAFSLHRLRSASHLGALELLAGDSDATLAKAAAAALERYRPHVDAIGGLDAAKVDELRRILGGLPETFEPYRAELHKYAVVDHATAYYIKAILARIPIGSASGKVTRQPGRKLVYRMPEAGILDEPETLAKYADMVIDACASGASFTTPPMIMLERQKNESGFRATDPVRELALTQEEKKIHVPMVGIDWNNWGRKPDGARSNYAFSELFTNSVGVKQTHRGYLGPITLSRGVGGGQVTLPTLLRGVSDPGRASEMDDHEWVSGIPVPRSDVMPTPGNWAGARTSIERARDLLRSKFSNRTISRRRDCTFGRVAGGKKYDCAACLARFSGEKSPRFVWNRGGEDASYHCNADASRWTELFGEDLASDDEAGRTEFPCSWLRAVQRYAGTGPASFKRILSTAHDIVEAGKPAAETEEEQDGEGEAAGAGDEVAQKGKKKKKAETPAAALRAAIVRARKRL